MEMQPAAADDRLGDLPDELLHRVLSLLPAEDAVRTCVLARRWRHLWKFATSLRIDRDCDDLESLKAALEFVDHLLLLREVRLIDTCRLYLVNVDEYDTMDDHISRFKLWIRHILMCQTRVLSINIECYNLDGLTFISDHLEVLHLASIGYLEDGLVDFSRCPALKNLEISNCNLGPVDTISSHSLKCLVIDDCQSADNCRVRIDTPNLHSLRLEVPEYGRCPLLQKMPSLVEAFVKSELSVDRCDNSHGYGDCGDVDCDGCYGIDGDTDNCVLLQGLSEAQNLVLKSDARMFIFRRDLKFRPMFGNLRTLLLNENWCCPDDFDALAYMLHHSPMLEKLTLELYFKPSWHKVGIKGRCNSTELSTGISHNLKIVDVKCRVTSQKIVNEKCEVTDERFLKVLKFLGTLGINFNLDEVEILK